MGNGEQVCSIFDGQAERLGDMRGTGITSEATREGRGTSLKYFKRTGGESGHRALDVDHFWNIACRTGNKSEVFFEERM